MPIKTATPLIKEYRLKKSDDLYSIPDEEATFVSIRQATQGDMEIRAGMLDLKSEFSEAGGARIIQNLSWVRLHRKEVFLTLAACNIRKNDSDEPLFEFSAGRLRDETKFEKAWATLAPAVAQEIWEKVIEHNPQWSMDAGEQQ